MNRILRFAACGALLLAFVTQLLPQSPTQRESAGGPQAAASPSPSPAPSPALGVTPLPNAYPFHSPATPLPRRTPLIRNATIMAAAGPTITDGSVLLRYGKIAEVGTSVSAPADALVIDATGKYVTPGLIDVHSH